ncbi:MAG: TrmH family RNA methyltransferase [Gaiellaceae bacterium]
MITSVDNVRVKDVLRLRKSRERRREGLLVAEGPREVGRAIAAGLVLRRLYVASELSPDWRVAFDSGVPGPGARHLLDAAAGRAEEVSGRVLSRMAYRRDPEGVLAIFEAPRRALPPDPRLILVAVKIEKPGNLGAMARTADAAGADALLVAGAEADPWNPNAIRASTGSVFTLPILGAAIDDVRGLPMRKVAAVVDAPLSYTRVDLTGPTALIVGAEDEGLDAVWREAADVQVSVPMNARTADSLNAATCAALLLFEAVRQRDAA